MNTLAELNRDFGRPGSIDFETSELGGPIACLAARGNLTGIALQGAQVLSWLHQDQQQLWLSPVSQLGTSKPVRGGIPVCWPWFGPHPADGNKPAHGFVRTRYWTVARTHCSADLGTVSITFSFATGPEHAGLWPYEAEVLLTVTLGAGLSLALETINKGSRPLLMSEALHTYFSVTDIADVRIVGLDGVSYIDKVDQETVKLQTGDVVIDCEVDRIYLGKTAIITLRDKDRAVVIRSQGSASAVVWNPWVDKTIRLGDMGAPDAFSAMVCIETTNAANDVVLLPPGGKHVMIAEYSVL